MTNREYRRMALTELERERLDRGDCPVCGTARKDFQPRNKHATCCRPACSEKYWHEDRPTVEGMRKLICREQGGLCKSCKKVVAELRSGTYDKTGKTWEDLWERDKYILDHIIPLAMGGAMWDRDNLQVLCSSCNKAKTARDMGRIAWFKRTRRIGPIREDMSLQMSLGLYL
jgi:5-methylcytosine-specific restriction endonuclease McrA